MEVPKGYISKITVPVPEALTATITVTNGGITIPPFTAIAADTLLEVELPYAATHAEANLNVAVAFTVGGNPYVKNVKVEVVTPYVELHEVKKIIGGTPSDEECFEAEQAARLVINAHTGQSFGLFEGTYTVMGNFDAALPMPAHVVSISKIDEGAYTRYDTSDGDEDNWLGKGFFEITGTGWFLKRTNWGNSTWNADFEWSQYTSDPITYPASTRSTTFANDVIYTVTGVFGYETVPPAIHDAAALLVNDYACADREYRERYLESIKSADWRIQFNRGAFRRTGNARADKLLSPYVVWRGKVI